jgi:organic hydroperoxide reductase OsmC/OhrA
MPTQHRFEATLTWNSIPGGTTATYDGYSREHTIAIAGKPTLSVSAAPAYRGDAALHNPEDLLVCAVSSCHMLTYLAVCAKAGIHVLSYRDSCTAIMEFKDGKMRITSATLRPQVVIGDGGDVEKARALHEQAHHGCFIANSVAFPITWEAQVTVA